MSKTAFFVRTAADEMPPDPAQLGLWDQQKSDQPVYYHASPVKLNPGTQLVATPESRFKRQRSDRVYFSTDPWVAHDHVKGYSMSSGESHLYQVHPLGQVEDDPEAVAAGKRGQSHMAPSAYIMKRFEPDEAINLLMRPPTKTAFFVRTAVAWNPADGELSFEHIPGAQTSMQSDNRNSATGEYDYRPYTTSDKIKAHLNGQEIGHLDLHNDQWPDVPKGQVRMISVEPQYRRKGVGTALMEHAQSLGLNPTHTPGWGVTEHSGPLWDEGAEFAKASPQYDHKTAFFVRISARPATGDWGTFWHGSPTGALVPGNNGIHVGTEKAARNALTARIGYRADGKDWDGTQEYGKTLIAGSRRTRSGYGYRNPVDGFIPPGESNAYGMHESFTYGYYATNDRQERAAREEDHYPNGTASFYKDDANRSGPAADVQIPLDAKPDLFPLTISGPMNNTPETRHPDYKANGYMKAALTKGVARNGYFYRNEFEAPGSTSAVVPSGAHITRLRPKPDTSPISQDMLNSLDDDEPMITTAFFVRQATQFPANPAGKVNYLDGKPLAWIAGNEGGLDFWEHRDDDWQMTPAHRAEVANSINSVRSVLPGMKPVSVDHTNSPDSFANAGGGQSVSIGKAYADDNAAAEYGKNWSGGISIGGGAADPASIRHAVIVHEMGHNVQSQLERLSPEAKSDVDNFVDEPVTHRQLGLKANDYNGGIMDQTKPRWQIDSLYNPQGDHQSVYANENRREYYAEAFADGMLHGDQASTSGQQALALAQKHLGSSSGIKTAFFVRKGARGRVGDWGTFWHGSPSGDMRGSYYGLHVGTQEAARQALENRIGFRADGKDWDGTQEYGKTLLKGIGTGEQFRSLGAPDYYPTETDMPKFSNGSRMLPTHKPDLFPVKITGPMNNTPWSPYPDFHANGYMQGALKRGTARNGYFYNNVGEDAGSVSAVLPSGAHIQRLPMPTPQLPPTTAFFVRTAVNWEDWSAQNPGHRLDLSWYPADDRHSDYHEVRAQFDGEPAGSVKINVDHQTSTYRADYEPHEIRSLDVYTGNEGRGIARSMLQHAQANGVTPLHSTSRTPDGDNFAKATPEFGIVPNDNPEDPYISLPPVRKRTAFFVRTSARPEGWRDYSDGGSAMDHPSGAQAEISQNGRYQYNPGKFQGVITAPGGQKKHHHDYDSIEEAKADLGAKMDSGIGSPPAPPPIGPDNETWYHLTDKPKFKIKNNFMPQDNAVAINQRSQSGLYVTKNPETWFNGQGYHRPYVAEISAPTGAARPERWAGEHIIPSEHLPRAQVTRVIPYEAWQKENYQSTSSAEDMLGTSLEDGSPVQTNGFNKPVPSFNGQYSYQGPDVRDMNAAQLSNIRKRFKSYGRMSQMFWRVHPNERPFSQADATSHEWGDDEGAEPGYSSFTKPEHLFGYFNPGERDPDQSHIISFSGHQVGTGMDNEPLAMPDMKTVQRHSWNELAQLVGHNKVQQINQSNGWETGDQMPVEARKTPLIAFFVRQSVMPDVNDYRSPDGRYDFDAHEVAYNDWQNNTDEGMAHKEQNRAWDEANEQRQQSLDAKYKAEFDAKKPPQADPSQLSFSHTGPGQLDSHDNPPKDHTPMWNDYVVGIKRPNDTRINGYFNGQHAGVMDLKPSGTIHMIQVDPQHQLKGIGNAMFQHAKSLGLNPQHSNDTTPDGYEFKQRVSKTAWFVRTAAYGDDWTPPPSEGFHVSSDADTAESHSEPFDEASHAVVAPHPDDPTKTKQYYPLKGGESIYRGMVISGQSYDDGNGTGQDWDPGVVSRIESGTASAHDILSHGFDQTQPGEYWHHPQYGGVWDAKNYAYAEEHPGKEDYMGYGRDDHHSIGEMGIVLEGAGPKGWEPEYQADHGDDQGKFDARMMPLMGASFLPHNTQVPLKRVHYHSSDGVWHSTDATGHNIHIANRTKSSSISFEHYPNGSSPYPMDRGTDVIHAFDGDQHVGVLRLTPKDKPDPGTIDWVHTNEDYRGRGIGTQMLNHAQGLGYSPVHAPTDELSPDGAKFRKKNPQIPDYQYS